MTVSRISVPPTSASPASVSPASAFLTPRTSAALRDAGLDPSYVADLACRALTEDLGGPDGVDVTTASTIGTHVVSTASVVARASGVVAGLPAAAAVFEMASAGALAVTSRVVEGARVEAGDVLATVYGPTRALLSAERSALNLFCRLSGIATHTRAWVDVVAKYPVKVLDTRKTTPGLRALEKYAVRCGGGANKRMGLFDA
ncbi:MAG: nicotinate-nucleotide diphosphorylase, partial [Pseudonocardiaceae bacterium]